MTRTRSLPDCSPEPEREPERETEREPERLGPEPELDNKILGHGQKSCSYGLEALSAQEKLSGGEWVADQIQC